MPELHVFKSDYDGACEWIIAESAEEALAIWCEDCGSDEGHPESFERVADSEPIEMGFWGLDDVPEHCRGIAELTKSDVYKVTLTAGEWSKREPRGLLCSTEF